MSDRIARRPAPETVVEAAVELEPTGSEAVTEGEGTEHNGVEGSERVVEGAERAADSPDAAEGIPDRAQLVERIARSSLPPGLRSRLAEVAAAGGGADEVVQAVEEALPGVLRLSERDVSRPAHKAGEVFFRGDAEALSEEQAEQVARQQLARTGMLRGQRVRVED